MYILISFFSKYRIQKGSIAIIVHVLVKKDFTCEKFVLKKQVKKINHWKHLLVRKKNNHVHYTVEKIINCAMVLGTKFHEKLNW